jgi:3-hydroxyisobutyrate dehydrogenase-like beta-hydroxyacid dehydrogenase
LVVADTKDAAFAAGMQHAMKALNNFIAAAGFAACAEALLTGQRFGLDPRRMVEILNVSTRDHTEAIKVWDADR